MHFVKKAVFSVALLMIFLCSIPAWGKVYIDINAPAFQRYPTAVCDFRNAGPRDDGDNLSNWFSDTVTKALTMTGFFRVIPQDAFLQSGKTAGITLEEIDFTAWTALNVDFLITGAFAFDGTTVTAEFRLFDVYEGKLIVGKRYRGSFDERKTMVYKFVESMLEVLTGDRGVFDTEIAFVGAKGKTSEVYTVSFDGERTRQLTNFQSICLSPEWSPDGKHVSFTSYVKNNPDHYILDVDTKKVWRTAHFDGINLSAPWSPDGAELLLVLSKDGNEEIYTMNYDSRKLQRLTRSHAIDVSPTWSPDGERIAFVSNRSGSPQIFVMDNRGNNVRRLTFEGSYNTSPAWSPVADKIAYEGVTNGHYQIFVIDADGGEPVQVTFGAGGAESPSWSPDGMYIAFWSATKNGTRVCVVNANGMNVRTMENVTGFTAIKGISWSPHINVY